MSNVTHTLKIKGKYFNFIDNGSKDIEVRVGYSMIKKNQGRRLYSVHGKGKCKISSNTN